MTNYFFHARPKEVYLIHKMTEDFEFQDTYRAIFNEHNQICDCPAWKSPCKHLGLLEQWLGFPMSMRHKYHYNDQTHRWEEPPEDSHLCLEELDPNVEDLLQQ